MTRPKQAAPSEARKAVDARRREATLAAAEWRNRPNPPGVYTVEQRTTADGRVFDVLVRRHSTDG
jgi:hypothetical protein